MYIYCNPLRQILHRLSASLPPCAGPPVQTDAAKHTDARAFMQIHPTSKTEGEANELGKWSTSHLRTTEREASGLIQAGV